MYSVHAVHELSVLVKNKPITEYRHENQFYVEGRKGSSYRLKLKNRSHHRVLYVVSVDGLDVVEGKPAGIDSAGYVVAPYGEVLIEGWKVNSDTAAKFEFQTREKSYSSESGQGADNVGVIGLMVFNERYRPPVAPVYPVFYGASGVSFDNTSLNSYGNDYILRHMKSSAGGAGGAGGGGGGGGFHPAGNAGSGWSGWSGSGGGEAYACNNMASSADPIKTMTMDSAPASETPLGTGFGAATEFRTVNTTFERANPSSPDYTLVLYYDSRRGLERRGIVIRPHRNPNPFPASDGGCTPPPAWRG